MKVDPNLLQDVIDRILKHGDAYTEKLRELNDEMPADYREVSGVRVYPINNQVKKDNEHSGDRPENLTRERAYA